MSLTNCAIVLCLFFGLNRAVKVDVGNKYQYQETMKTSASEYPHYGSGYYPQYPTGFYGGFQGGYGGKYIPSYGGFGNYAGGFYPGFGGYGGAFLPGGYSGYFRPNFYPYGGHEGGYVDKKNFIDENKKAGGESYEKGEGSKGESGQHGSEGFSQGQVALKDIKGDSGYYNNQEGDKKGYNDGRSYYGGQQFNQAGGKGERENQKANHRKGHTKNGFRTTHHKDESGSQESFYDEAHDEGDSFKYGSNEGSFGLNGQSAYKGGHENGQFIADEKQKQGHYDRQHIVDNANGDKGQYGQKGYHGNSNGFVFNKGIGQQSLLGKQEANRLYYNQHPHGYVPIYDDSY